MSMPAYTILWVAEWAMQLTLLLLTILTLWGTSLGIQVHRIVWADVEPGGPMGAPGPRARQPVNPAR